VSGQTGASTLWWLDPARPASAPQPLLPAAAGMMCFRVKVWGNMWETGPSAMEDFVLRQDPRAKDAWAIISALNWLLHDSNWSRRGLSMEQLAQELRRYTYRCSPNAAGVYEAVPAARRSSLQLRALQVLLPAASTGAQLRARMPTDGGLTPPRVDNAEERREKLMQRVAKYEFRSRVAANAYWKMLLKTGLPETVLIRILRFLELRITDLTGPVMYCMRCKEHMNLAALIDHVSFSRVHIDATVA
jgi:hypothetical protein